MSLVWWWAFERVDGPNSERRPFIGHFTDTIGRLKPQLYRNRLWPLLPAKRGCHRRRLGEATLALSRRRCDWLADPVPNRYFRRVRRRRGTSFLIDRTVRARNCSNLTFHPLGGRSHTFRGSSKRSVSPETRLLPRRRQTNPLRHYLSSTPYVPHSRNRDDNASAHSPCGSG